MFPLCDWIHLANCGWPPNIGEVHTQILTSYGNSVF